MTRKTTIKGRGKNPASLANIGKGRPPTGRKSYKANLLPSEEARFRILGKNRGEGMSRALQLLRLAYAHMSESGDPQAMAWCDEVEPLLEHPQAKEAIEVKSKQTGETEAWIV